jgi:hypothetical protein
MTSMPTPTPWTDLLSRRITNIKEAYGPNSRAVNAAFGALSEASWLEHVGEPWLERVGEYPDGDRVVVVRSWDEALTIFDEDPRYNINGLLQAPCDRVDDVLSRLPERRGWWESARNDVKRYIALSGIPDFLPQERQDLLFEHLYEFVSMLLVEIIAAPEAGCTYFREQLPWFHAGHFPCGWDGDWPNGRMRVY